MGIVVIVAVLLGVLLAAGGCAREIGEAQLFYPHRHAEMEEHPGRRNVLVPIDPEGALRGWYLEAEGNDTTIIYFYGNGESVYAARHRMAWMKETLGVNVLALDYRGYGFSDGAPTVDALVEDAVRGYDWLKEEAPAGGARVLAYGRSIGTAPALELADRRPIDALILEAPFPGLGQVVEAWQRGLRGPARWFLRLRADQDLTRRSPQPLDLIQRFERPLLVIHGSEDTVIHTKLGRDMFEAAPGPDKTWCEIDGAGHNNLSINHPDMEAALVRFVEEAGARPIQ